MTLSRRQFAALMGAGAVGTTMGARFLRSARAQAPAGPMRFLAIRTPHGVDRNFWIPKMGSSEPPAADMSLMDLSFDYERSILSPLTPWRDKITILDGLDTRVCKENTRNSYGNHGHNEQGSILTGAQPPSARDGNYDGHQSLDFFLHSRLSSPALITASVEGTDSWKCMSYDDNGRARAPQSNPQTVFRQAFPADFEPTGPTDPTVDFSNGERRIALHDQELVSRLRDRLSGSEHEKLMSHYDAMQRLVPAAGGGGGGGGSCSTSGSDTPSSNGSLNSYQDVEAVTRAQANVITQAFACGRSRVATLQLLNDYPNWHTDLPEVRAAVSRYPASTFRFHENLVHDYWTMNRPDDLQAGYTAGLRWNTKLFSLVLEELDMMVDPLDPSGGTVLDNTIVFWHNEFGHDGHDNQHTRHPAVLAGGGGRVLKMGRYLRLRGELQNNYPDTSVLVPHNKLLTSICQAMGLSDVNYFGDRDMASNSVYQGPLLPLMV